MKIIPHKSARETCKFGDRNLYLNEIVSNEAPGGADDSTAVLYSELIRSEFKNGHQFFRAMTSNGGECNDTLSVRPARLPTLGQASTKRLAKGLLRYLSITYVLYMIRYLQGQRSVTIESHR